MRTRCRVLHVNSESKDLMTEQGCNTRDEISAEKHRRGRDFFYPYIQIAIKKDESKAR